MKKKQTINYSLIIGICIGVVVLLLTVTILFEGYQKTKAATSQMMNTNQYQMPSYGNGTKSSPDSSLGSQLNNQTAGGSASESKSYQDDLSQTQDDGGASDLKAIDTASSGL